MGDTVHVIDRGGRTVEVDPDYAALALRHGFYPASPQQIKDYELEKKYGTGLEAVKAGAESAASTLTFGGSTWAEKALGVDPEAIAARERFNPLASGIGTGVGIAGPLAAALVTGGGSAVAEGAGLTAPSLISRAGGAVASGVESIAGTESAGLGARIAGKALARAAQGATEGVLYEGGNLVHEAALGDPNEVAEHAFASLARAGALGGVLGGIGGTVEGGVSPLISKAKETLAGLTDKAAGGDGLAKAMASVSGQSEADVEKVIGDRWRLLQTPQEREAYATSLRGAIEDHYNAMEKLSRGVNAAREDETDYLARGADAEAARKQVLQAIDSMNDAAQTARARPSLYSPRIADQLESFAKDAWSDYKAAGADMPATDAFEQLNGLKRDLQDRLKLFAKEGMTSNEVDLGQRIYRGIRDGLEDPGTWGEAGARQASFNDAITDHIAARKALLSQLGVVKSGTLSAQKLSRLMDQLGTPQGEAKLAALEEYLKTSGSLIDQAEATHANAPTFDFDRGALSDVIDKTQKALSSAQAQRAYENLVTRMTPASAGRAFGMYPLGKMAILSHIPGVGPAAAGVYGAARAIGGIVRTARNVPAMAAGLARLEGLVSGENSSISALASKVAKAGQTAAQVGRAEVLAGMPRVFAQSHEAALAQHEKRAEYLSSLAASPEKMQAEIEKQIADIHGYAPNIAQSLAVTSATALAFLHSKLPQVSQPGPLAPKSEPNRLELARFNRYYAAIERPTSLLKQAAARTLTPEAVEAVQAVYPKLMDKMRFAVMEAAAKQKTLTYQARAQIGMLTGMDVDGSLASLGPNQMAFGMGKSEGGPAPGKTSARAGKITLGSRMLTGSQAATQRAR